MDNKKDSPEWELSCKSLRFELNKPLRGFGLEREIRLFWRDARLLFANSRCWELVAYRQRYIIILFSVP
jgi:hypothetical protein